MTSTRDHQVSDLLVAWSRGDASAMEKLMPIVYGELRRMAAGYLRKERPDHTLQPTALVHETYLRLVDQKKVEWRNRAHFFAIAAKMMRRVLVDHARTRQRLKRGGEEIRVDWEQAVDVAWNRPRDLLALDDALHDLAALDPRKAAIVEYHFFAGFSVDETAEITGVSPRTVSREWQLARAWLFRELERRDPSGR